jgi:hypothetical protein
MAGFQRIGGWVGYALLVLWEGYWLYLIASDVWSGTTHTTPAVVFILLAILVGWPLIVFLLWRLLLWIILRVVPAN